MTPDTDEIQSMKESYALLATETLLDRIVNQAEEFRPEALQLMEEELRRRGVSHGDIEERRAARPHHPGSDEEPEGGDLIQVAAFEERLFAEQAQDVLRQKGIEAMIADDPDSVGPNEFPFPDVEGLHQLLVPEVDAGRARLLLESFTPASEEGEGEAS